MHRIFLSLAYKLQHREVTIDYIYYPHYWTICRLLLKPSASSADHPIPQQEGREEIGSDKSLCDILLHHQVMRQ